MYSTIKDYFDLRLAEFNASNGSYLIEVSTKLNNPPAGQRQRNYTVTLSGFEEGQLQSEMYNVEGEITLTFNLINKNIDTYETLQQYVYNLARYIRRKHQYSVNNKKWNVREISGSDLDNILNDKLVCKLEFTGDFYETNAVTITAPSTPTLSTPANAGTGTVDQSFNWTAVSGAISYTFEISDSTGILFTQSGLSVSSFTIPADSLLTAGTVYQWRVKAVGEGGSSAWTGYFSFTASSTAFEYEAETDALEARHTVAPDGTRKGHMNTLYAGLKTDALLDKIDVLQIYQSHSVTSSDWGLNWRKNAHNAVSSATAVGTGINAPVTTNGSTSYIKTNYSPATEGVAYGRDRASMGYLLISTDTSAGFDVGYSGTAGVGYILLQARNGSTQYSSRLNTVAGAVISGAQNTSIAFHTFVRSDVNTVSYYRNGTLIQTSAAQTGSNVPAGEVWIGGSNALTFRAGSYGVFYAGGYLSATDVANLVSRLTTYITAIGGTV